MLSDDLSNDERVQMVPVLQANLVSDGFVPADHTDPNLVNPWGVSHSATSPFWVSDNGTGVSTLYNGAGASFPLASPLVVTIPSPPGQTDHSTPTGQVFNTTASGFTVSEDGRSGSAVFLFATEDGTISGWNPTVDGTHAILAVDNSDAGAVYKGLAIASTDGSEQLYAANFHGGTVDVFDSSFKQVNSFTDPFVPKDYAPFNVQVLDGHLFVTFAQQDDEKHDDVAGPGHGFVDEFDLSGHLLERVAANGPLDSPWGLAIAPGSFGTLAGDLLIGNFGDGTINVFDRETNAFAGKLEGADGQPVQIDGLWALITGNGGNGGDPNRVYFTAGPEEEAHGLFGSLTPLPTTPGGEVDWNALAAQVQANFAATGHWFV
jgi:uncharacterized protein (TIGR03118 family)